MVNIAHSYAYEKPEANHSQYFYLYQIPYKILVALTKMSFLFLYLDIFPEPRFRLICTGVNMWTIAGLIAFTLVTTFQCTPIPYNWNKTLAGGGHW